MEGKTILLQDQHGHSKAFSQEHAERLLAYPGTQWSKKDAPKAPAPQAAEVKPK